MIVDGLDIWSAIAAGGRVSPRSEIPVNIAACGADAKGAQSIVDGPQAAMIVGDLKVIVNCWWRSTKDAASAQLYNLTADPGEMTDLSGSRPDDVTRLLDRLDFWEKLSVPPYSVDKECGKGEPQGNPPHWDSWC